jgi:hypothetical protein
MPSAVPSPTAATDLEAAVGDGTRPPSEHSPLEPVGPPDQPKENGLGERLADVGEAMVGVSVEAVVEVVVSVVEGVFDAL